MDFLNCSDLALHSHACYHQPEKGNVRVNQQKLEIPLSEMERSAAAAAAYLKTLAHERRLMILCHLGSGEKSVTELEALLNTRQAAVSQMLARLREEKLVSTRRDGKTIYYNLADQNTAEVIGMLYRLFCAPKVD